MYKLTDQELVIRTTDGACIPFDPDNKDYQDYLKWLETGNEPLLYEADITIAEADNGE